jgi:hypothetical protein
MKRLIFSALFLLVIASSCKTVSYFSSSNDLANQDCTVFFLNGTEKKGSLTIQLETGQNVNSSFLLKTSNLRPENISIDSIKYYSMGNDTFCPKAIDLKSFEIPYKDNICLPNSKNTLLVKRLTSKTDRQEHFNYFVSFSTQDRLATSNIRGSMCFPGFNEKMAGIVADCPALMKKIKAGQKVIRRHRFPWICTNWN